MTMNFVTFFIKIFFGYSFQPIQTVFPITNLQGIKKHGTNQGEERIKKDKEG